MFRSFQTAPCVMALTVIALTGTGVASAAGNDTESSAGITGFDLRFISDSNPAKAEFERDIEATSSIQGRVTGTLYSKELMSESELSSGLSLNAQALFGHDIDIEELGETRFRVSGDWFLEDKSTTKAPFYRFSVGLGYLDSETQIRDSVIFDLSTSVNIQPTNFFDGTLGLSAEVREADTEVFDTTKATIFLTANFTPIDRFVLRTGLRYVFGNEVSTATPTLNIVNTAEAIEADNAFGGRESNRFAYLLDANSAIFEVGIGYFLTHAIEANLLYRLVSTEADNGIGYDRNMLEFTLSYSL